jgi:hypothetical protein
MLTNVDTYKPESKPLLELGRGVQGSLKDDWVKVWF